MTGRRWLVLSLIFFLAFLYSESTHAATINAASCSQSDVQSAVNSAARGDTVVVPAGNCSWSSVVSLGSKPITLQGAGSGGGTTIADGRSCQPSSGGYDLLSFTEDAALSTRITGFAFTGAGYAHHTIGCSGASDYSSAPARIDHNSFATRSGGDGCSGGGPGGTVLEGFSCRGLVDHNSFTSNDNSETIHNWGPGASGWTSPVSVQPGSTNALYVETNTFYNSNNVFAAQSAMENYDAARVVGRYNQVANAQFDTHGGDNNGTRWFEFYNNNFCTNPSGGQDKYFDIRAGSGVIFGNTHNGAGSICTATGSSGAAIVFRGESRGSDCSDIGGVGCWVGMGISQKLWSPAYVWGNGSDMPVVTGSSGSNYVVTAGVNYIVSATQPASMVILERTTDSCGSNGTNPGIGNTAPPLASTAATGCTTYSYAPFTYPYPLDSNGLPNPGGSGTTAPAPPTGLQVSVT